MTPVHMSAREFKALTRNVIPGKMGRGELMHLHLLVVEAVHGRLTQEELRSERFTESRETFVKNMLKWKGQGTK